MRTVQHGSQYSGGERIDAGDAANSGTSPGGQSAKFTSPSGSVRWVAQRKAEIVDAVRSGSITLDQARERYALSIEEFLAWQHGISLFGLAGLRVYGTRSHKRGKGQPADDESEARPHRKSARHATRDA